MTNDDLKILTLMAVQYPHLGQWHFKDERNFDVCYGDPIDPTDSYSLLEHYDENDYKFIAAANPSRILELLNEVEELKKEITLATLGFKPATENEVRLSQEITTIRAQLNIAKKALKYYADDPAYKESTYIAISSNFRSGNAAQTAISKIEELETK
jgi:hypothetical protein